uniref:Ribosomal protein L5 n=1 Tax=Kryptoperidinium foliaceum endosymbiont TaxID=1079369 RepID=I6N5U5_9STRA|nr:ribosomal protein L5 [Kryptoperidinium foliaceum endosymbiont]
MNILQHYYKKIIKRDLINKFSYTHLEEIPQLKKIILNFGCKNSDIRSIASVFLSLELVTTTKVSIARSKRANVLLKIRKGNPVGCMVVLRDERMYHFLFKLLSEVLPNLKSFAGINVSKKLGKTSFSFTLKDLIHFKELEKQFYLFINLPPLNITLITNTKTKEELLYLLQSFKLSLIL